MAIYITTQHLPIGYVGEFYRFKMLAQGIPPNDIFWETPNQLPPNLTLDNKTGVIQGFCIQACWKSLEFIAKNVDTKEETFCVIEFFVSKRTLEPLTIITASLVWGGEGRPYHQPLVASGGVPPYEWTSDLLPSGLSIKDACISGMPNQAGEYHPTITVTDSSVQVEKQPKLFRLMIYSPNGWDTPLCSIS